jgi:asparagine synthase (glutamine-hydrolysing)
MCGIIGAFGKLTNTPEQFKAAIEKLKNRGPDGEGFLQYPNCYLGHRRLSIIDLESGHQPMVSEDGRFSIIFNGEIYNYQELRKSLASEYSFKTHSDTEVIIALYKKYDVEVVKYLEGMFALALYDRENNQLFLARDPMGMKPLVYYRTQNECLFASEIKALLPVINEPLELDQQALYNFLCLRHIPAPHTIFTSIKKLPAGHYLLLDINTSFTEVEPIAYWRPQYIPEENFILQPDEVKMKLVDSVKAHLVADVPVGAFLSGGLDSSAIVWAMKQSVEKVPTFTVGFKSLPHDLDLQYARQVAKHLGTDHHEIIVDTDDYRREAEKVVKYFDEPFADSALISNYYVAREVSGKIKVALSGDGADELFFGYPIYNYTPTLLQKVQTLFSKKTVDTLLLERYFSFNQALVKKYSTIKEVFQKLIPAFDSEYSDTRLKMRMFDLEHTLPEYYLHKTDLSSMFVSLEVRTPFTHRPLVDYVLTIPLKEHYNGNVGKRVLQKAMEGCLPPEIITRKKQGFSRPAHTLLTAETLQVIHRQLPKLGLFNMDIISEHVQNYLKNGKNSTLVWRLLVVSWWLEEYGNYLKV